jgi:PAS domain S-box-containing protein
MDWQRTAASKSISSRDRKVRWSRSWLPQAMLFGLAGAVIVAFLILVGAALVQQRQQSLAASVRTTQNLARTLEEHAIRSVHEADMLLSDLCDRFEELSARAAPDDDQGARLLGRLARQATQYRGFALIDEHGRRLAGSSGDTEPLDLSDRDYFTVPRDHPEIGLYIAKPFFSRITNIWSLAFSRRIARPDGGFGGVALAVIDLSQLQSFYAGIDVGRLGNVTLWDGTASHVLARYPVDLALLGKDFDRGPLFEMIAAGVGEGTSRSVSPLDGVKRIVSFRRVGDLPLVVSVAVAEQEVLANWRQYLWAYGIGAVIGSAILLLLTVGLSRQFGQQRRLVQALRDGDVATAEASRRLQESEQRFRDFADTASDWYWETDANHRFSYVSERILTFGVDPAQILGKSRLEIASDLTTEPAKWRELFARLDRREPFTDFVYCNKIGGRDERYSSNRGKPLFDENGTFLGYRGSSRDVTESFRAEARLHEALTAAEAANRAKSEFLAGMSHELRTPLNAIIGFSDMLRSGAFGGGDKKVQEYATDIHASGQHLLEIINDILELSRIEAGRLELHEAEIDVGETIAACLKLVAQRAEEGGIALRSGDSRDLPHLFACRTRFKQILINLLSNAVKFTPAGGEVAISAALDSDGALVVTVRDTGIGMTADELLVAMQPFRQVDHSVARRYEGTGLGLPLTKVFVELHGGHLAIDSTPGVGTTARALFPAERVLERPAAAESGAASR